VDLVSVAFMVLLLSSGALAPAVVPREAMESVRWTRVPERDLGKCSCADTGQGLVGGEVRGFDGHGFEVWMAVEAEELD
jgi:hypothetical protein